MHPSGEWLEQDIDRLLELLPAFEEPGLVVAVWPDRPGQMPYPDYHPVVERFYEVLKTTGIFCDPYAVVPGDPPDLQPGMETAKVLQSPADIERANLAQLRRYFILCSRLERFCDGYFDGQFRSGNFVAALRRLKTLREST